MASMRCALWGEPAPRSDFKLRNSPRQAINPRATKSHGSNHVMVSSRWPFLLQRPQAFLPADHFLNPHAEVALHHYHFAAGDHAVVHDNLDWLDHRAVQLHDGAG